MRNRVKDVACLLLTLTNTRPTPATVVVPLEGGQAVQFALLSFQKLEVYPPLVVLAGYKMHLEPSW